MATLKTMVISSDFRYARQVQAKLLSAVHEHGYSKACIFAIRLAVEEAINNAIRHGNSMDTSKKVEITFNVDDNRAVITITDEGTGFEPSSVPDPTRDENLHKPSGRGIMLINAYMDEVEYNDRGNVVRMLKKKS